MEKLTKVLCRVCCENPGKILIFKGESPISDKLLRCCSKLNIDRNDEFSQYICIRCDEELSITHNFLLKCESADEKFRGLSIQNIKYEYESDFEVIEEITDSGAVSNDFDVDIKNLSDNPKKSKIQKKCVRKSSLKCKVCGKQCANQSTFTIHLRSHTDDRPYICPNCGKKYRGGGSLKRHMATNHSQNRGRNFICDSCGKGFYTKNELKTHMHIHAREATFACTMCPKRFNQLSAKLNHQKRHKGDKTHICGTCRKKFCTKTELKQHYQVHSSEKNYSCIICNARFKFENSLKTHTKSHMREIKFVCNICDLPFTFKGNLGKHIKRIHSNETQGHCDICNIDVYNINIHMCKHTGEMPFACEYCPKRCQTKNSLSHHINFKHKQADKFKCEHDNCALTFPSKRMLDYHITKSHENVKPYKCKKCSRKFYRKCDLNRHVSQTHKLTSSS